VVLFKENHTQPTGVATLDRKSGGAELRCAIRVARKYRSTITFPFAIPTGRLVPACRWTHLQFSDETNICWKFLEPPRTDIEYEQMPAEKRLTDLGLTLPEPPAPGGNYVSAKTIGNLVYLSGVISTETTGIITGTAGADRTIPEGYAAARACALTQLAVLKRALGSLDKVREVVSVNGYVNAIAGFPDSPAIINGASDLLIAVFEDQGRHVRAAVGVSALPRNALVELQMVVAI
jgi:enamine deaminase RidA (YjgF/YER057c/UK114 family)